MQDKEQVFLLLADGSCFAGHPAGAPARDEFAELVFTTAMSGYTETLTDPGFSGQIILQTFPLIGNYGYSEEDMESRNVSCLGYVTRHLSPTPSNFRSQGTLDSFLKKHHVVGITGVDTRMITRKIREEGVMNAVITADPSKIDLSALKNFKPEPQLPKVSVTEVFSYPAEAAARHRVVIPDTGVKNSIIRCLQKRGCEVKLFPYDTPAERLLAEKPDGIVLAGGPGEPSAYPELCANAKKLAESNLPIMGISFGHHLLALAHGLKNEKMKYGHRGENQAVQDTESKRIYITQQNHGYVISESSLDPAAARVRFRNAQDHSIEGLEYIGKPQFSVEFQPKGAGGPHDTMFLFDRFIEAMEANHAAR